MDGVSKADGGEEPAELKNGEAPMLVHPNDPAQNDLYDCSTACRQTKDSSCLLVDGNGDADHRLSLTTHLQSGRSQIT